MSLKKKIQGALRVKKIFYAPKKGQGPDKILQYTLAVVLVFGLISLSSASSVVSYDKFDGDAYRYFKRQLFGLAVGLIAYFILSKIDYHIWRKYALGFLVFSIFLLILVFIPGLSTHYGKARSWINIFGFSLQPSEFVKLSFLLYLAAWLETKKRDLSDIHEGIGPFVVVLGIIGGLMLMQPDIGTLSIISLISLIVYFVGGGKKTHIAGIILIGVAFFVLMLQFKPYQMDRLRCYADPSFSPDDICYQINQSLIAVGSGGIFGRGLGESRQKYMYLPEVSGDSIFAIIAEEMGLVVSTLLIILFLTIFYRGYRISLVAPDDFGKILAIGISSWISIQAFINIGGIINLMPMTGVPLPLISYGGSAILSSLAAFGVLVNISSQGKSGSRNA